MKELFENNNPFDPIYRVQRKTPFVAESPQAKAFKKGINTIFDPMVTTTPIHAIVGNYGSGKSHVNSYIYQESLERDDVIACYVSIKEIIVNSTSEVYERLLNKIIQSLGEADEKLSELIDELYSKHHSDDAIRIQKQVVEDAPEEKKEHHRHLLRMLKDQSKINTESFFSMIDSLYESDIFSSRIKKMVIVIDELEKIAKPEYEDDMQRIVAMREQMAHRPEVIWVFSCIFKSFESLRQGVGVDMFSEDVAVVETHELPTYNQDDRMEMIMARMKNRPLGSIKGLTHDDLIFPFSTRKRMDGKDILRIIAEPQLSPRKMVTICFKFYGDFAKQIQSNNAEKAFDQSRKSLFERSLFDIISFEEVGKVRNAVFTKIGAEGYDVDENLFDTSFKELFKKYLINKPRGSTISGFRDKDDHREAIDGFLMQVLGLKKRLLSSTDSAKNNLLSEVSDELIDRCFSERKDPSTGKVILAFNFGKFRSRGELPHRSEILSARLINEVDSDYVSEDDIKSVFTAILDEENHPFEESIFELAIDDLLDSETIEKVIGNEGQYKLLKRRALSSEEKFYSGIERLISDKKSSWTRRRDTAPWEYLQEALWQINPLNNDILEIQSKCIRAQAKYRLSPIRVIFHHTLPANLGDIREDEFTLVITFTDKDEVESLNVKPIGTDIFCRYEHNSLPAMIMTPSREEWFDDGFKLNWHDLLSGVDTILEFAEEVSFTDFKSKLSSRLLSNSASISTSLETIERNSWDEGDYYELRFIPIGNATWDDHATLLAEAIRGDVDISKRKVAKNLTEIYPWLEIKDNQLRKIENKCRVTVQGLKVCSALKSLVGSIASGTSKTALAKAYFDKIESQHGIQTSGKKDTEKMRQSTYLLLEAASIVFDEYIVKDGDQYSIKQDAAIAFEPDRELLEWVVRASGKDTIEALVSEIGESPVQLSADLNQLSKIVNKLPHTGYESYLSEMVSSKLEGGDIERYNLLDKGQGWGRNIISSLHQKCKDISETELETRIDGLDKLNKEMIKNIDGFEGHDTAHLRAELEAFQESASDLADFAKGNEPDINFWNNSLSSHPSLISKIQGQSDNLADISSKIETLNTRISEGAESSLSDAKEKLTKFITFSKGLRNLGYQQDLQDLQLSIHRHVVSLRTISDSQEVMQNIRSIKDQIQEFEEMAIAQSEEILHSHYSPRIKNLEGYKALASEYNDDLSKLKAFDEQREKMKEEIEDYMREVRGAVENQRSLKQFVQDGPMGAAAMHDSNMVRITKSCLSKKYKDILDSVIEARDHKKLMRHIYDEFSTNPSGLEERLKFLTQMEERGIIEI